jgi:hypothetical protein
MLGARAVNAVIGLWLFFSAFLWPHSRFQALNAWVVGALAVTAALAATRGLGWARYLNAALGGWLIVSAILPLGQPPATLWNHVAAGFLLVLFSMLGNLRDIKEHPGRL